MKSSQSVAPGCRPRPWGSSNSETECLSRGFRRMVWCLSGQVWQNVATNTSIRFFQVDLDHSYSCSRKQHSVLQEHAFLYSAEESASGFWAAHIPQDVGNPVMACSSSDETLCGRWFHNVSQLSISFHRIRPDQSQEPLEAAQLRQCSRVADLRLTSKTATTWPCGS